MAEQTEWGNEEGRIRSQTAYLGVVGTAIAFQIANQILIWVGPPKSVQTDEWKFRNLFISWIHAVIVGIWDILCFIWYPELMVDPVITFNVSAFSMVTCSTGYFLYDFIDLCRNKPIRSQWEILLHHIVVGSMFFYNLVTCQCIGYNVIALTAEINSVFLHARKLMQLQQVDFSSTLYRVNVWFNLATFVLCRFIGMVAIIAGIVLWYDRVSSVYLTCISSSMIVMIPVNIVLFQRLLRNDVYRFRKNAYHNKYVVRPSETTSISSEKKTSLNGAASTSSNNNTSKTEENGHAWHAANGYSNGVVSCAANESGDDKKHL